MNIQKITDLLENEIRCVKKADEGCDRDCMNCELVMDSDEILERMSEAISLLHHLEERKPLPAFEHQKAVGYRHRCPTCNCAVGYLEKKPFRRQILIEHAARYCHICGQALRWEDKDEHCQAIIGIY